MCRRAYERPDQYPPEDDGCEGTSEAGHYLSAGSRSPGTKFTSRLIFTSRRSSG